MPKGFHYGRSRTRSYTDQYCRLPAIALRQLLELPLGTYSLERNGFSEEHKTFKLTSTQEWDRIMLFTIKGKNIPIPLQEDDRSASKKLYLICPYCVKQRQHLYVTRSTYACRECLGLHYASQSKRKVERLARRIRKLRVALWGFNWPDVQNLLETSHWWPKPVGKHYETFIRQRDKIEQLEKEYWQLSLTKMSSLLGEDLQYLSR